MILGGGIFYLVKMKDENLWTDHLGQNFNTIKSVNSRGERIWVKFEPLNNTNPIKIINLLDKPNEVTWEIKESHAQTIDSNKNKTEYSGIIHAGSIATNGEVVNFNLSPNSKMITFPIESIGGKMPSSYKSKEVGTTVKVDAGNPCWIGYAILSGNLESINKEKK